MENICKFSQFADHIVAAMTCLSKPNENSLSLLIYPSHALNLIPWFRQIVLIDSKCIDPQHARICQLPKVEQGQVKIDRSSKYPALKDDRRCVSLFAPHVGERRWSIDSDLTLKESV